MSKHTAGQTGDVEVEQVALEPAAATVIAPEHDIPEGGYGWVIVSCIFVINFTTWGNATSFGVYLAYYLNSSIFPGATPLDYALVGGLQFGISMLLAPIVTPVCARLKLRPTMWLGVCIHSLGWIFAGLVGDRLWALYITQGLLIGVGLAFCFIPAAQVLPQYFWKRRTLAVSIGSAGAGLGGVVFSVVTDPMIRQLGIGWALRITGIICFIFEASATFFMKDRNSHINPTQHGLALYLLKRKNVLMLLSYSFFVMLGYMPVIYSLSTFARSLGVGDSNASLMTALLNVGIFFGRPLIGFLSDKYGRLEVALFCSLASAVCCLAIWIPTNSLGTLIFLSLSIGSVCSSFWSTISSMAADVVGIKEIPSMLSLCWLSVVLPTSLAEVMALYLRKPDQARPYLHVQIFAALAYLVSALFLAELIRMKRKAVDGRC